MSVGAVTWEAWHSAKLVGKSAKKEVAWHGMTCTLLMSKEAFLPDGQMIISTIYSIINLFLHVV